MTDEQINIAIAESLGWINYHRETTRYWWPPIKPGGSRESARLLPDFANDLNSMHEAEKALDAALIKGYSKRMFYASKLGSLTNNDNGRGWQPLTDDDCFPIAHATARQRAEAYLRTIGKWK